jgi:hypothetical protein
MFAIYKIPRKEKLFEARSGNAFCDSILLDNMYKRYSIAVAFNLEYAYPRGCAKTSSGVSKIDYIYIYTHYFVINIESNLFPM